MDNRAELPPEEIAKQSVDRFKALATAKYMAGQKEHGGCLVDKVKLAHWKRRSLTSGTMCTP